MLPEQAIEHGVRRRPPPSAGVYQVPEASFHVLPAAALPTHHQDQDADRGELQDGSRSVGCVQTNRRELIKDQLSRQSRGYRDFISSEGVSVGI